MKKIAAPIIDTICTTLACNSCKLLPLKFEKTDSLLYLLRLLYLLCLKTVAAGTLILTCSHYARCHKRRAEPVESLVLPSRNGAKTPEYFENTSQKIN